MDQAIEKRLQRFRELRQERDALAGKVADAEAAVAATRKALDAAKVEAVIQATKEARAAATAAEEKLDALLQVRDRLEDSAGPLEQALEKLAGDLAAGGKTLDAQARTAACTEATARVEQARPALEDLLVAAGLAHLTNPDRRGVPLEAQDLPRLTAALAGIDLAAIRRRACDAFDAARASALETTRLISAEVRHDH